MPCSVAQRAAKRVGRAVRDRLGHLRGLLERVGRDGEVGRERQLLQADERRALAGGGRDPLGQRRLVLGGILVPALLDEADPERRAARLVHAGERRRDGAGGGDQLLRHRGESNLRAHGRDDSVLRALFDEAPVGLGYLGRASCATARSTPGWRRSTAIPAADHIGRTPSELLGELGARGRGRAAARARDRRGPSPEIDFAGETPAEPGVRAPLAS